MALCFRKEIKLLMNELDEEKKMRLSLQVSTKMSQEPLDVNSLFTISLITIK